jgi:hypothetical protein
MNSHSTLDGNNKLFLFSLSSLLFLIINNNNNNKKGIFWQ